MAPVWSKWLHCTYDFQAWPYLSWPDLPLHDLTWSSLTWPNKPPLLENAIYSKLYFSKWQYYCATFQMDALCMFWYLFLDPTPDGTPTRGFWPQMKTWTTRAKQLILHFFILHGSHKRKPTFYLLSGASVRTFWFLFLYSPILTSHNFPLKIMNPKYFMYVASQGLQKEGGLIAPPPVLRKLPQGR